MNALLALRSRLGFVALAVALGFCPVRGVERRFVGTDLLGIEFSRALLAQAGEAGMSLRLALDGSRPALEEIRTGRADVGLVLLPPGEEGLPGDATVLTLAYFRVVVLVPAACPLAQISIEQLGGVFGSSGYRLIERWGDLGVGGEWQASAVMPWAPESGTGLTVEFFRHTVLQGRPLKPDVTRYRDGSALERNLGGGSRALALAAFVPPESAGAKVLAVALRGGAPAFLPSEEHLHSGAYPFRLPLRVVYRPTAQRELVALLRFVAGEQGAAYFERAGFVPIPATTRVQQLAALEKRRESKD